MARWQGRLERKQAFLGRIVDIGAELFAMSAAVRAGPGRRAAPRAVELADLFCRQARLRVDALFDALWDNTDAGDGAAAREVLDGRYASLEEGILAPTDDRPWVASWAARSVADRGRAPPDHPLSARRPPGPHRKAPRPAHPYARTGSSGPRGAHGRRPAEVVDDGAAG